MTDEPREVVISLQLYAYLTVNLDSNEVTKMVVLTPNVAALTEHNVVDVTSTDLRFSVGADISREAVAIANKAMWPQPELEA